MPQRKRSTKRPENKVFQGMKSRYLVITVKTVVTVLVLVALAASGWWVFAGDFFQISRISCQQDGYPCREPIQALFQEALGKNIFLFKTKTLALRVGKQEPTLANVSVTKHLPDELGVAVTSRQPFALLTDGQGAAVVVDKTGVALPVPSQEFTGPRLVTASLPVIGEVTADSQVLAGLRLIELFQLSYIPFEYISYPDKISLTTQLSNKIIATFSAQKDLSGQVDSLQYILHHSRMEDKAVTGIDLRFQKPIITFTQPGEDKATQL